jgi:hypothetical protein
MVSGGAVADGIHQRQEPLGLSPSPHHGAQIAVEPGKPGPEQGGQLVPALEYPRQVTLGAGSGRSGVNRCHGNLPV